MKVSTPLTSGLIATLLCVLSAVAVAEEHPRTVVLDRTTFADPIAVTDETTSQTCLECHGEKGFAVPIGVTGASPSRALHVDLSILGTSVHGVLNCVSCHQDIAQMPHKKNAEHTVDCVQCHAQLAQPDALFNERAKIQSLLGLPFTAPEPPETDNILRETGHYLDSIHAQPNKDNPKVVNASCWDCHGKHNVFPADNKQAQTFRLNSPQMCSRCHQEQLQEYTHSVHGAAVKRLGNLEAAVCSDCHSAHKIASPEEDPAKLAITENCGSCHQEELSSYRQTYHGQVEKLGYTHTAKCADCHAPHNTLAKDNPKSMVHDDNRLETCQQCHKEATLGFAKFQPHGNTHDFERFPEMYITSKFMIGLLFVVFLFFWTHSLLWFYRERQERKTEQIPIRVDEHGAAVKKQYVRRFSVQWRIAHLVLAIAVMVLVLTGTAVLFADSFWAPYVIRFLGGAQIAAIIHRVAAVIFGLIFFGHIIVMLHNVLIKQSKTFEWFGPNSLLPRWQDWHDMVAMFKWFFGKGERPVFDRWTYWEKFDYWAPFWGMLIIGLSGLTLWFPEFFGRFLPGWIFNVSTILHGEEAFLAAVFLFTVHFFNCHFRPEKFPQDTVMFTGVMTLEEFKEEREVEYKRLEEQGRLEEILVGAPSPKMARYSEILGFTLIGIGLILLVLVIVGFLQQL